MKVIRDNCRVQFTPGDIEFVTSVLGRKNGKDEGLRRLLDDPESLDLILDDKALFHAVREIAGCLRVSERFYFYVLVRRVLLRAGISDRRVADYIAEVLSDLSQVERTCCQVSGRAAPVDYFFEMIEALEKADNRTAFHLCVHIGNHSLYLSGVFPERVRHRTKRRASPSLEYYESMGRAYFRRAGSHLLAQKLDLAEIFNTLSDRFQEARLALNDMSGRLLVLGGGEVPRPPIQSPNIRET